MKYLLLACFVAFALAGPRCTTLMNANFDDEDTIVPWLTNSYNGGTSSCHQQPEGSPLQCELLQANSILDGSNAGRISVGQHSRAICRTPGSQGNNVFQANIGMCRGNTVRVHVGQQDQRNGLAVERFPTKFSLVVGRDNFDLLGGVHTEIASHTFTPNVTRPFNNLEEAIITGTWSGPSCGPVCPDTSCWAVGVRIERDDVVRFQLRQYIDNLEILDEVVPSVEGHDVTERAAECDGTHSVTTTATASDNCCADPAVRFCRTVDSSEECWPAGDAKDFPVGCTTVTAHATDNSGNENSDTFQVCIMNPMPTISCNSFERDTQTCWTSIEDPAISSETHCGAHSVVYDYAPEGTSGDFSTFSFPIGASTVEACIDSDNGLGGTDTACCNIDVNFNLCCQRREKKRSALPKLIKK